MSQNRVINHPAVVATTNDLVFIDDDAADGDLADGGSFFFLGFSTMLP